ncbi:DUF4064 domain-containing protein [Listeria booriae]|uniref:DUF4064 domain-containing protein n=2 Tax=Listeria booriae TaxID=1552123 RepID=A0A7X0XA73_9LIST|nr:DUF4064 domain-containing protein [Listeria booriae]MBC1490479.1 DUF4064 domain-containing protein [Listeria booriae]MBC1522976.1 DUF4064 domain-containing protein [Listeria booriae]MBC1529070.1 DUF4064 domain-containing protein [Listeria booriae]
MMSRTVELVLGLIGSIVGLVAGFWIVGYGDNISDYIQTFTYLNGALGDEIATLGWVTVVASALALIASLLIKKNPRGWGVLLVLIGILMFFVIGQAWIISGILLILAGLMGIFRVPSPKY